MKVKFVPLSCGLGTVDFLPDCSEVRTAEVQRVDLSRVLGCKCVVRRGRMPQGGFFRSAHQSERTRRIETLKKKKKKEAQITFIASETRLQKNRYDDGGGAGI